MSYNGSGTFQINTSGQPVVTGTVISSSAFNALTADLATGLSTAITKDGQTATTVRIPFAQGINSTLATDATSTSTGSIYTAGGVGIAKALYVGTTANIAGTATVDTITSKAATALTLKSAGTTAVTIDTSQNTTFAGTLTTAAQGIAKASLPTGSVLQVVSVADSTQRSTSSASFVASGMSVTITPTSATSKILIQFDTNVFKNTDGAGYFTIFRGATNLAGSGNQMNLTNIFDKYLPCSIGYLDSPSSTSALTYALYFYRTGSDSVYINASNSGTTMGSITVMEIAG